MVCIFCSAETQVTNSRPQKRTNTVWRRRKCQNCGNIFTTEETALLTAAVAVERPDGTLTGFNREKLLVSLYNSLRHRSTALQDATALTDTVISKLMPQLTDGRIQSTIIITTVTTTLKRFDRAASVQYAAYHPLKQK